MTSKLGQGQALRAISLPDYCADGAGPFVAGEGGIHSITVSKLAGPMGWYDVAVIRWNTGRADQIHPLHMLDFIQLSEAT